MLQILILFLELVVLLSYRDNLPLIHLLKVHDLLLQRMYLLFHLFLLELRLAVIFCVHRFHFFNVILAYVFKRLHFKLQLVD